MTHHGSADPAPGDAADRAVVARLAGEFAALSERLAAASADLTVLDRVLEHVGATAPAGDPPVRRAASPMPPQPSAAPPPWPAPPMPWSPPPAGRAPQGPAGAHTAWQGSVPPGAVGPQPMAWRPAPSPSAIAGGPRPTAGPYGPPHRAPMPPHPPKTSFRDRLRDGRFVGKALAVVGVGVTLVGVVLLLVLAAQAGILRPEVRVSGGLVLAAALLAAGIRLHGRAGGRIGAIALSATGMATAYLDVVAATRIYDWLPGWGGLLASAAVAAAGLTLARRWDSEHLGLLVLVPLIVLAPVLTAGINLPAVTFLLVLAAASLPAQLGRDWIFLHIARIVAATAPLAIVLVADASGDTWTVAAACATAALLAVVSAVVLMPETRRRVTLALATVAGTLPLLASALVVDRYVAAGMDVVLAILLLGVVLIAQRLGETTVTGMTEPVRQIFIVLAATSVLLATVAACDGQVLTVVVAALATVLAVAGRHQLFARLVAVGFAMIGGLAFLAQTPLDHLIVAVDTSAGDAATTAIAALLIGASAVVIAWTWSRAEDTDVEIRRLLWVAAGLVCGYALTAFTVTVGVATGGTGGGFLAGHMAATICGITAAAGLLWASRRRTAERPLLVGAGLTVAAAAVAKLFLFDLATLDGMFRVVAFIVVGLILLGVGSGYARTLMTDDRVTGA
ncbi:proline-rich domain-containing protein [Williamsia sterculiae]|uniref:Predicted membrane protein n=1 Tax=Williamsia sterculiae TaxID=1344003 RepID=A0A1N7CD27_9NOCA|nr:DUF2339 domain-containing protein [Williamsia sterculiae]SIR61495.1 Predicted membrane protein [Williamsia sterculiae]